jgi:hypothetical protein
MLTQRAVDSAAPADPTTANAPATAQPGLGSGWGKMVSDAVFGTGRRQGMIETMAKSAIRSGSSRLGSALVRGVLGSLLRK